MLRQIRREIAHRNLLTRAVAVITGMSKDTVGAALRGASTTRRATVNLLYSMLVLERDRGATKL